MIPHATGLPEEPEAPTIADICIAAGVHGSSYWNISAYANEPDLDDRIKQMLEPGRLRIEAELARSRYDGTTSDLLRLVGAELDQASSPRQDILRHRWALKIDKLASRLRSGDSVIDCGCGFGTEAIAFARRGAVVTAVDLFPHFLQVLRHRVAMYVELLGGEPFEGRIDTRQGNLTDFDPGQRYDYLWSNESIEHIAPLDSFLKDTPGWLRPGGLAVICNDNAFNIVRHAVVARARKSWRAPMWRVQDPKTGRPILYAVEDIRAPTSIRRCLLDAGFRRVELEFCNVVPSVAVRGRWTRALADKFEGLARVPLLRYVAGGDYIVLATR